MGPYSEKKKDCVPEGPCAGDMISPMGHDSKTKFSPADGIRGNKLKNIKTKENLTITVDVAID